jgi:hypothetical protein
MSRCVRPRATRSKSLTDVDEQIGIELGAIQPVPELGILDLGKITRSNNGRLHESCDRIEQLVDV